MVAVLAVLLVGSTTVLANPFPQFTDAVTGLPPSLIGNGLDIAADSEVADLSFERDLAPDAFDTIDDDDKLDLPDEDAEKYRFLPIPKQKINGQNFDFAASAYDKYAFVSRNIISWSDFTAAVLDFKAQCDQKFPAQAKNRQCKAAVTQEPLKKGQACQGFALVAAYPRLGVRWYVTKKEDCNTGKDAKASQKWCLKAYGPRSGTEGIDDRERLNRCYDVVRRIQSDCLNDPNKHNPPYTDVFSPLQV
ncbi:hypothetical protein HDU96_005368 [Phlyctochytrium bullatum]|nr:hypothetical protein HDU96_005368 [Phlyctochytrium bullatum]